MLEDHAADFIERSSPGHGVYREHGAEPVHKIFGLLQRTYCSMQPATIRLQSMLKRTLWTKTPRCKGSKTCNSEEKLTPKGTKFCVTKNIFV